MTSSYPTALTMPADPTSTERGIAWVLSHVKRGERVLVWAPGQQNIRGNSLVATFTKRRGRDAPRTILGLAERSRSRVLAYPPLNLVGKVAKPPRNGRGPFVRYGPTEHRLAVKGVAASAEGVEDLDRITVIEAARQSVRVIHYADQVNERLDDHEVEPRRTGRYVGARRKELRRGVCYPRRHIHLVPPEHTQRRDSITLHELGEVRCS